MLVTCKRKVKLTSSTCLNTRRKLRPANFFKSSTDQRASSSNLENRFGYLETSSSPRGVLQKKVQEHEKKTKLI